MTVFKYMKWKLLIPLIPLSFVFSFVVYRMTDENLNDTALRLSEPIPSVLTESSRQNFKTNLSHTEKNPCADGNIDKKSQADFVNRWKTYQAKNIEFFNFLLQVQIHKPIVHSMGSILGHQDEMSENRNWIKHFEHHICFLQLTKEKQQAVDLLKIFISSLLKSFDFAQPFSQNIQSVRILKAALIEIEKFQSVSGFEQKIQLLDFKKLTHSSHFFHFQSVINSIENLKSKMKLTPKVYLPSLMIQPGRLKNQMALMTLNSEPKMIQANPRAAWYDVKNLELIYLSLFQKSILGQPAILQAELFELKELATDLSRKSNRLENDKSVADDTK